MSTALLSQGTTLAWGEVTAVPYVTRIVIGGGGSSGNDPEISIAHLGSCHCKEEPFLKTWAAPSDASGGQNTVQVDFMGVGSFAKDQIANLSIAGGLNGLSFSKQSCTCISVQTTAQVGDVLRGSATIRFA